MPADMLTLHDAQKVWWRMVRYAPLPDAARHMLRAAPGTDLEERMALYRDMYWTRQIAALQSMLPKSFELLGAATFNRLMVRALRTAPSTSPALEHLPARLLPAFVDGDELSGVARDLLRIETAMMSALVAPEDPRKLYELPTSEHEIERLHFRFCTGTAVLRCDAQSLAALKDNGPQLASDTGERALLVGRSGMSVQWSTLGPLQASIAEKLVIGGTLQELCAAVNTLVHDEAQHQVVQLLAFSWREQLLAGEIR